MSLVIRTAAGIARTLYEVVPDLLTFRGQLVNVQLLQNVFDEINVDLAYTRWDFFDFTKSETKIRLGRAANRLGQALDEMKRCIRLQLPTRVNDAETMILNDHLIALTVCGSAFKKCVRQDYETQREQIKKDAKFVMNCLEDFIRCVERINDYLHTLKTPTGASITRKKSLAYYLDGTLRLVASNLSIVVEILVGLNTDSHFHPRAKDGINNLIHPKILKSIAPLIEHVSFGGLYVKERINKITKKLVTEVHIDTGENWASNYVNDLSSATVGCFIKFLSFSPFGFGIISREVAEDFAVNLKRLLFAAWAFYNYQLNNGLFAYVDLALDQFIATVPIYVVGGLLTRSVQFIQSNTLFYQIRNDDITTLEKRFRDTVDETLEELRTVNPHRSESVENSKPQTRSSRASVQRKSTNLTNKITNEMHDTTVPKATRITKTTKSLQPLPPLHTPQKRIRNLSNPIEIPTVTRRTVVDKRPLPPMQNFAPSTTRPKSPQREVSKSGYYNPETGKTIIKGGLIYTRLIKSGYREENLVRHT